jgi:hypothetical protein
LNLIIKDGNSELNNSELGINISPFQENKYITDVVECDTLQILSRLLKSYSYHLSSFSFTSPSYNPAHTPHISVPDFLLLNELTTSCIERIVLIVLCISLDGYFKSLKRNKITEENEVKNNDMKEKLHHLLTVKNEYGEVFSSSGMVENMNNIFSKLKTYFNSGNEVGYVII